MFVFVGLDEQGIESVKCRELAQYRVHVCPFMNREVNLMEYLEQLKNC
jgi:hypothetical protein